MKKTFFAVFFLFLTQCISTGTNFPSRTDWIKENQTSQSDVKLVLGQPFSVGTANGVLTWTYACYLYPLF